MKRMAALGLVLVAGLGACNRHEPIPSSGNDPRISGLSGGHIAAIDPSILEDQKAFYKAHEAPAVAPTPAPAEATTATAPAPASQPAAALPK